MFYYINVNSQWQNVFTDMEFELSIYSYEFYYLSRVTLNNKQLVFIHYASLEGMYSYTSKRSDTNLISQNKSE